MKPPGFPKGWDERRVSALLAHYETRSEEEIVAEDETAWLDPEQRETYNHWPKELVSENDAQ